MRIFTPAGLLAAAVSFSACICMAVAGQAVAESDVVPPPEREVVLRLRCADEKEGIGSGASVRLWVHFIDCGLPRSFSIAGFNGREVDVDEEFCFTVPSHRRVGIAAMSANRGFVEDVIEAASSSAASEPVSLNLLLPEVSDPAEVLFSAATRAAEAGSKDLGRARCSSLTLQFRLPRTGIHVRTKEIEREGDSFQEVVSLPAGSYLFEASPRYYDNVARSVGSLMVKAGERVTLNRVLQPGYALFGDLVVKNSTEAMLAAMERDRHWMLYDYWLDGQPDPSIHWYAWAEIEEWDPLALSWMSPRPVEWHGSHSFKVWGALGAPLYSVRRFPAGHYRIRVHGPAVETYEAVFELAAEGIDFKSRRSHRFSYGLSAVDR